MVVNAYPPSPWKLTAHSYVGLFFLPKDKLPAPHSPLTKPITLFGRGIVGAAFFVYLEPSPLTYNEIMSTVIVRKGWRPLVSITKIWVDSEASRDGGRALWAIPKELADFSVQPHSSYVASAGENPIGSLAVHGSKALPVTAPIGFSVAQDREGELVVSKVRGRGRIGLAKVGWTFNPDGPMGYLAGRRPLLTLILKPLRIVFGSEPWAVAKSSVRASRRR